MKRQVKITQIKSVIGSNWRKKRTVEALGLSKLHHSVIHNDTPTIRGMIKAVRELVKVEEVLLTETPSSDKSSDTSIGVNLSI